MYITIQKFLICAIKINSKYFSLQYVDVEFLFQFKSN